LDKISEVLCGKNYNQQKFHPMNRLKIPSFQMTDEAALRLAIDAENGLTNNSNFPNITPTVAQLKADKDAYMADLGTAANGGREARAQKNAAKQKLIATMRQQVGYINLNAGDDEVKLAGTGYPITKVPAPVVLEVASPSASYGVNSGELVLSTPTVFGAVSYKHQYTEDESWQKFDERTTSTAKCTIANLIPGKTYFLRIVAIGTSEQFTISPVITKMAV
jgi:hypothetical protein